MYNQGLPSLMALATLLHTLIKLNPARGVEYELAPSLIDIDSCERRISAAGRYRLWGNVRATDNSLVKYCSLKINSPPGTAVRITYGGSSPISSLCSSTSALSILDGWEVRQPLKRQMTFLPRHLADEGVLVCPSPKDPSQLYFKSTYNLAEVIYLLDSDYHFIMNIEFVENEQECYSYISSVVTDTPLQITAQSETCVWRLPGAVVVTVLHNNCEDAETTAYAMVGEDPDSMNPRIDLCNSSPGDKIVLPCKYSQIVLKSLRGEKSSVQFQIRLATFWESLKSSYYCT